MKRRPRSLGAEDSGHGPLPGWRGRLHEIIYEADTPWGRLFDLLLMAAIIVSVVVVMLETVDSVEDRYGVPLRYGEWGFTLLFTIEYVLRLISVRRPLRYAVSFYGLVDLLSILPTYLSILFPATRFLLVLRALRMLRVFRVLKLARFLREGDLIVQALKASRVKISVFIFTVMTMVLIIGSIMYVVEGTTNESFDSIPRAIYWAIVTLTTVGYGDIAPQTALGQFLAAVVMILGYGMIAVPTGIVSVELAKADEQAVVSTQCCPSCALEGHDHNAKHCKHCGEKL